MADVSGGVVDGRKVLTNADFMQLDTAKIFQDYARNLAKDAKFVEALSLYSISCLDNDENNQILSDVGRLMIDHYTKKLRKRGGSMPTDPWSCCACASVLVDPVTIHCGHSFCKNCILKDLSETCKKCGNKYTRQNDPVNEAEYIKTSIVVGELVGKYWSNDLKAVALRNEGNRFFQRDDIKTSIEKYAQAFKLVDSDHLLMSNRSHAYYKLGDYEAALEDADRAIKARPDWGKGYFRKGKALLALDRPGEALLTFFQCLVFEDHLTKPLRNEIYEALAVLLGSVPDKTAEETEDMSSLMKKMIGEQLRIRKNPEVCRIMQEIDDSVTHLNGLNYKPSNRPIDPNAVKASDFECALCFRLLWTPVTTSCGHTYCRSCLDRALDHRTACPLCKTELENVNLGVNEFVDQTIRRMLPSEFLNRQRLFEDEMADLNQTRRDGKVEVPVFVCTTSFPHIPCPLHVFEPRYRLMIRRAMESGAREFGMCINDPNKIFSDYGTMVEIRDIQYFADGRSVVDTIGSRRFRVHERGTKDGYNTAVVEFMKDEPVREEDLPDLQTLHDKTHNLTVAWFNDMEATVKLKITSHYGAMPQVETEYWTTDSGPAWTWWALAILPLETTSQQQILRETGLKRRLEAISRILTYMKRRGGCPGFLLIDMN